MKNTTKGVNSFTSITPIERCNRARILRKEFLIHFIFLLLKRDASKFGRKSFEWNKWKKHQF